MMHKKDNVATLMSDAQAGDVILVVSKSGDSVKEIKVKEAIPFGHKIALRKIEKGEKIIKYGEIVGIALKSIEQGEWVHVHNVESSYIPERRP
jgi:altronate dehydratase small subunit